MGTVGSCSALAESPQRELDAERRAPAQQAEERRRCEPLCLNDEQKEIVDIIVALVDATRSTDAARIVFVDGPAGSGKTHLHRKMLH